MFARHGPSYRTWAVVTVMLGTVSAVMEATIVNVALPEIIRAFDLGHDRVQLLSTGFLAATTASMLLSHWALCRFGLRRSYMGAVALLMACSVAAAFAPSFPLLAACRIGQGIIAGMVQPLAMVAITDVFPREARGRAMSAYGLGIVLSPAVGPAAGGLLVDHFGWRSVFLVTVPLCLAALALAPRYLVKGREGGPATLDLPGLGLLAVALVMGLGGWPPCTKSLSRPRWPWWPGSCSRSPSWRGSASPRARCSTCACSATRASGPPWRWPSPMAWASTAPPIWPRCSRAAWPATRAWKPA